LVNKKASYTAASTFPVKVLQDTGAVDYAGNIHPRHIQLCITNKCNLRCSFCSCSDRAKDTAEMEINDAEQIAEDYGDLGCKAVTITGGGEPLMHSHINGIINVFDRNGIKVGLVTNGMLLNLLTHDSLEKLDWIRISFDDSRDLREVSQVLAICPTDTTDWAFSYVVSREPDIDKLCRVIECANRLNFTHVRVVSDLLDVDHVPDMEVIKAEVAEKINDDRVIYQGRKDFTKGTDKCFISLLKPVIDVDGKLYPCCGAQYALDDSNNSYNYKMCMGDTKDSMNIFQNQKYFDGSKCEKCYYSSYNDVLNMMVTEVTHREFV